MATAGDGKLPYVRAGQKFPKRPFQLENSTGIMSSDQCESCATTGISISSELEQKWKQMRFTTRSKIQHPTAMEKLPDEILLNIFIRLLAKQLAQMRSVSKSWNVLLSQPSFVKSHLRYSIRNKDQIFLLFPVFYREPFTQYSSQSLHLEPINFIKHTPPNLPMMKVIGSVNGLICLSGCFYSDIHIWNPSLSAVSAIPPFSLPCGPNYATSIRFGFDPKTDDYKLVKLTGLYDILNFSTSVKEWLQVEVYSMRKRSWELIAQPFASHIKRITNTDCLHVDGHDGHLHWYNNTGRTIVAFDLGLQTFREIPLPNSILDSSQNLHHLRVLARKLCLISCRNYNSSAWEVWVMEEYGVPESWVKCHVLSQLDVAPKYLFGFTSRSELLFIDKDRRLGLYDQFANKTKWTRTKLGPIIIVEYVDSLVWI